MSHSDYFFENEDVLDTVETDLSIAGALALSYVIAETNNPNDPKVTKTLETGVTVIDDYTFTVAIDKIDTVNLRGHYHRQARETNSTGKEHIIEIPGLEIKPSYA